MHAFKGMIVGSLLFGFTLEAPAASGEMGTGVPSFGQYGDAVGGFAGVTGIWSLANATIPFPDGCGFLFVTRSTMGADTYKVALATMLTAKATGRSVRFFAHASRDGGCGIDYVQLMD